MLDKAMEMCDNIEQNEQLSPIEAIFISMLHDLLQPVDDEDDDDEGEEDDD